MVVVERKVDQSSGFGIWIKGDGWIKWLDHFYKTCPKLQRLFPRSKRVVHLRVRNEFQLQEVKLELPIHNYHYLQLPIHSNLQLLNHYHLHLLNLRTLCLEKNALGDVKDQADDKANPKPWYTADEKSGKMSSEDLQNLIREYPLPEGWYARLPGLQEPANYDTKFKTGVYEEQVKSGYRLPLHPFALRFFEHYRMAPGQLVPNGYKPDATDFMRVFFEICFVKGVANCPRWYYIHSRQRLLKGGPKSNKGWHSRYFFVGRLDKGEHPFDRDWNPFCKDFKNPGKPTPNNQTKYILSHIKLRGGLCINEPISEEQLEWAKIIPPRPIPTGLLIPSPPRAIPSMTSAETVPLEMASRSGKSPQGGFLGVLQKAKGKRKEKQPSAEFPLFLRGLELLLQNVLHVFWSKFPLMTILSFDRGGHLGAMTLGCRIARSRSSIFFMGFFLEIRKSSRLRHTKPLPAPLPRPSIR
ncbi:hypothetical protein RJ639_030285 [Escallonia herrerae]|uniref:Uncharacterized protein n=1 Tax=Escallonia herrerae TaxID=1293975 RepID=A0AA89BDW7_9ASTE|nr:hypothetical protein RJ639_030285 [Escallonia herrerae]